MVTGRGNLRVATLILAVAGSLAACRQGLATNPPVPSRLIPTANVTLAGTLFRATMPTAQFAPSPLVLGDETGLVTGIEPTQLGGNFDPDTRVVADPTEERALILAWLGGACEGEIDVSFARSGSGYTLGIESHPKGTQPCPAVGIPHALRIHLSTAVPGVDVSATGD
jgi:hypothetical protein